MSADDYRRAVRARKNTMLSTSAIGKNRFDRIFRVKRTLLNVAFTRVSLFDRLRSFPQDGPLADLKTKKMLPTTRAIQNRRSYGHDSQSCRKTEDVRTRLNTNIKRASLCPYV